MEPIRLRIELGTATERRFVKVGSWLIEAGHFRELWRDLRTDRMSTVVPYFAALPRFRSVLKVLRHWEFFKGVSAPIAADVICVRNNIRTFYLNRPETVNVADHAALLAKACGECPWDGRWLPQRDFLRRADEIMSGSGLMTFSYSHGDLGAHNILLAEGSSPYVIDWEHARRMPTVRELYRSINEVPGVFGAIQQRMDALRAVHPEMPILSFCEQFLIIALQPLLVWGRRGRRDISTVEHRQGTAAVLHLANKILHCSATPDR